MHEHIPEFYVSGDGERVAEPVYRLLADCFLGMPGRPPALWEAGTELQHNLTPNDHMQPLNRAAAVAIDDWRQQLPPAAEAVSPDELLEASNMLMRSRQPGDAEIPYATWRASVYRLAMENKVHRGGMRMPAPPSAQPIRPLSGRQPPPMTAGDYKDVAHRDQAATGMQAHPQSARRMKPKPTMSTEPPPANSDGVKASA